MNLDNEFRVLDRIPTPSLWSDIDERAGGSDAMAEPRSSGVARSRVAAVVAFAVFAGAAVFAWTAWRGGSTSPATPVSTDPWSWALPGWTELPQLPMAPDGISYLWTGTELLAWGGPFQADENGVSPPASHGYAFDPVSRTWSSMPSAPLPGDGEPGIWTGSEAWFFTNGGRALLSYDPDSRVWRELAEPPILRPAAEIWTGRELIVWGGGLVGTPQTRAGAIYDPSSDSWQPIADAPVGMNQADAVWTGDRMIVVGAELDRGNNSSTRNALALSYDPESDSWSRLDDPPVSPQTSDLQIVAGTVIAWENYSPAGATYDPSADRWSPIDMGIVKGQDVCFSDGVVVSDLLFAWNCGSPAVWSPATTSWIPLERPLPVSDPRLQIQPALSVGAGSGVVVEQVETTLTTGGEPYIGSPNAPVHLWLWKPSETMPSSSTL